MKKCSRILARLRNVGVNFTLSLFILLQLSVCTNPDNKTDLSYISEIEHWQQLRVDSLKGHTGFLNLAGLFWINNEVSTIGADSASTFVFPEKAAKNLGKIVVKNDSIWFVQQESGLVIIEGDIQSDTILVYLEGSIDLTMRYGDLNWFIIKRGTEYGIRLKDYNHPLLSTFDHIDNYPIEAKWKVKAIWEEYPSPKKVMVHNQVGMDLEQPVPGALHFELEGDLYILEPIGSADDTEYFVMIYDKTSGHETYGSGRYLYVPRPDDNGITFIDFNKAFNPPCVYTEFATCLFPHETNRLPLKVTAGEKYSGLH